MVSGLPRRARMKPVRDPDLAGAAMSVVGTRRPFQWQTGYEPLGTPSSPRGFGAGVEWLAR